MAGALRRSSIDSKSGTGMSPGSSPGASPAPSTVTPPSRARRTTASTSSTLAAPLMTYWRMASGEQPAFTSATTRKVSSTLAVCAESPLASDGAIVSLIASCKAAACTRACWRMSSVCRCSPKVRTCKNERIDQRARNADAAVLRERCAQDLEIVEEILHRTIRRQRLRQLVLPAPSV